jgi:phosphoglycolate phosphatase
MKKVILFDLDGTLIDSTDSILESFSSAFQAFNQKRPESELIKAQIGHPLDMMFMELGIGEHIVWDYVAAYKKHYQKIFREKTTLLPGALESIELASKHAQLGVVTTKTARYSIELLEDMKIMHYFDTLIGREDVKNPKPDPEPIQKALIKLQTVTDNCYMIGDTCMDMIAAKCADVTGVGVLCGYGTHESLSSCGNNIYKNSLEAVTFIIKQ